MQNLSAFCNLLKMERWRGRTVLVTGASSGIGLATAETLAKHGMKVIGCARNVQTLLDLNEKLGSNLVDAIKCDLTKEEEVVEMYKHIGCKYGTLDALVNNAGMSGTETLAGGNTQVWRNLLELNIIGLSTSTREALKLMESGKTKDGHIINLNSYIGHHMPKMPAVQFYSATKHMTVAITEALRMECQARNIRVTSLSPGIVETEFAERAFGNADAAAKYYSRFKCLEAKDVAEAIVYILSVPSHVNVDELTLTPHQQERV